MAIHISILFISLFFVNQINFQLANFGSQNKFMRFTIELSYSSCLYQFLCGIPHNIIFGGFRSRNRFLGRNRLTDTG
ncbi:Uncharacterised protein [Klebsiella pneumoniae]|nr:Uncharacterised protein [Klebsiella pneumoniae]SWA90669.1 Uncharacterised protein [Klebsiella pneumoniae]SWB03163.1 Uncharacterised protein [Klebsiella pneumoniae]